VLLHESLQSVGKEDEYKKIEGKTRGMYTFIQIVATFFSGLIAAISLPLTLFLSAINVFIATVIAGIFKTPTVDIDLHKPSLLSVIRQVLLFARMPNDLFQTQHDKVSG
jgi:hypothetical protein